MTFGLVVIIMGLIAIIIDRPDSGYTGKWRSK